MVQSELVASLKQLSAPEAGWMWGIVGIILAVPILATFKIFCSHLKPMEPLAEFIS